ncbi:hypothetical protein BT69DRAFT_419940 [Atractiella rhizophila]|nr:hypothetical protein BT69DRAFT_419940 [Atractiella rhizophila]
MDVDTAERLAEAPISGDFLVLSEEEYEGGSDEEEEEPDGLSLKKQEKCHPSGRILKRRRSQKSARSERKRQKLDNSERDQIPKSRGWKDFTQAKGICQRNGKATKIRDTPKNLEFAERRFLDMFAGISTEHTLSRLHSLVSRLKDAEWMELPVYDTGDSAFDRRCALAHRISDVTTAESWVALTKMVQTMKFAIEVYECVFLTFVQNRLQRLHRWEMARP